MQKNGFFRIGGKTLRKSEKCGIIGAMDLIKQYGERIKSGEESKKFAAFYALLSEYNEKFNLTRITGEEDCFVKHFLDSAAGEKYFPKGANVAEIGSGGGFPSVPLMILRPDLTFTLVESTEKKCSFLERAVLELGLPARVVNARAEELAKKADFREKFDVCCARAVARLNTLAEYCLPFVKPGGLFVAYKGKAEEETKEAEHAFSVLGGKTECAERYTLPEGEGERTLVVVRKVKNTPSAYPRGKGKERSRPL